MKRKLLLNLACMRQKLRLQWVLAALVLVCSVGDFDYSLGGELNRRPLAGETQRVRHSSSPAASTGTYEAYRADILSGFFVGLEEGEIYADDIEPIGGIVTVARYEVWLGGLEGAYEITTQLWSDSGPGFGVRPLAPILGTVGVFNGLGNGDAEQAVHELTHPVLMPTPRFWIAYSATGHEAGPLLVGDYPQIGFSEDCFSIFDEPDPGQWSACVWYCETCGFGPCCTFQTRVWAVGDEPAGACCDLFADGPVCRDDVPFTQCEGRWIEDGTCADGGFDPPCGTAACCDLDENCSDIEESECAVLGGYWQPGEFCDTLQFGCPPAACITAPNDCDEATVENAGCNSVSCCQYICGIDNFCCLAIWDESCVMLAADFGCEHLLIPDECDDAREVTCNDSIILDNTLATDDSNDPPFSCHDVLPHNGRGSVWAEFVATSSTARLRTCDSQTPADDSLLAVYSGSCGNLTEIACNDDSDGCAASTYNSEVCVNGLTLGETYYVQLASWTDVDRGRYTLELDCPASPICELDQECPAGVVTFLDPPSGVVDARQPNPVNQSTPLQGIKTFTVFAPTGADDGCFRFCETVNLPSPNSIESVTDDGAGTYTITLARPITPYAITRLAYQPDSGAATIGTFIAHPANVNGDSQAGPTDILAIIDCLNGVNLAANCSWGIYSSDIDHSGVAGPADILRVIDLLNGVYICGWPECPEPGPSPLPTGTCIP